MKVDVVCLGNVNVDMLVFGTGKIGDEGERRVKGIKITKGGNAANCAAICKKLGLNVSLIGRIGNDFYGNFLKNYFKELRVRTYFTIGKETGCTIALINENKRFFLNTSGENENLSLKDINLNLIKKAKHFHRGGLFFSNKLYKNGNLKILKFAKENGVETSVDLGNLYKWDWIPQIRKLLQYIDIFFLNEIELKKISGKRNAEKGANFLIENGVKIVALHRGASGTSIFTKEKAFSIPSFKVKVLNPVGAGDAYNAGFIFGLLKGYSLEKTATIACATAALHIMKEGDYLPNLKEIRNLVREGV